jgi:hypothetical protein
MSSGVGKVFKAITLDQFMPWRGDSDPISNLAGNIFMPGVYTGVGMYKEQKEEKEAEAAATEKAAAEAAAAEEKANADSLAAAAEAESEKLRKRKGYKATILTGTNQDSLGPAPTGKAALMG